MCWFADAYVGGVDSRRLRDGSMDIESESKLDVSVM